MIAFYKAIIIKRIGFGRKSSVRGAKPAQGNSY
jgi:hypothetical protein